jgi:signal transduction histidine kinase
LRLREQDVLIRKQIEEMRRLQSLKEDMVALLVHDLRSPLSGVVAHLQLLGEEVTGESKSDVQYALRAADTTLQRLDETLQIRLIEEGQLVIHPSEVLVETVIDDVLTEASGIARRKKVTLRPDVDLGLTFSLDRSLMRRSVENLVSNAIKYAPMGSAVSVSAKLLSDSLAIEVSDEGPGVPDSLKSSMFTKFGSIEAKQGSQRTGFGLGLYLVKLVADRHGGSIAIEDREGGGSVFRLVLRAPSV